MNIDKQALREKFEAWAEEAGALPWGYLKKQRTASGNYSVQIYTYMWHAWSSCHEALLDESIQLQREKDAIEAVALALRDDMRDAREQLEAAEKRIAEQREYYEGVIADGSKRIAELERSETQLINERDYAESALNAAYKAVMGQAPEWSNWFSFENAIEEMELACELWRNQTDDVIQFRQRIQELEAKLANPVLLPKTNGYWNEQEKAYEEAITLAKQRIRLAGFRCEGDE
ncbi:ead/Ea22-like family protein [Salmonella enterica subsp. diarizonae]|nr:ead/Ea22-like family protein [Salmonella enterica subsp. diarizonae]ECJ5901098.1 ead/Ea22-like family protein [Salmonella enterica subsp. diarizonae]EIG1170843.1 ead/Ea22-like family protein [Salmonella enterica subsp. diarizonae serovar 48:k:z53]EKL3604922.1 ead/Ea22-like family protein [Salmonella enterica]